MLEGAPQGEARQIWWDEKLAFQFDEDDDEEAEGEGENTADTAATASTPPPVPGTPPPPPRLPPPAASAATTTSQGGEGAENGAVSTKSPAPASEVAVAAVVSAVGVQADAAPSDVVVEEGASASVAAAAPTAPAVPLA